MFSCKFIAYDLKFCYITSSSDGGVGGITVNPDISSPARGKVKSKKEIAASLYQNLNSSTKLCLMQLIVTPNTLMSKKVNNYT